MTFKDRIDLPPVQQQLANYIIALGKPTVIFLLNGGMVAVEDFMNKKNVALIEAALIRPSMHPVIAHQTITYHIRSMSLQFYRCCCLDWGLVTYISIRIPDWIQRDPFGPGGLGRRLSILAWRVLTPLRSPSSG